MSSLRKITMATFLTLHLGGSLLIPAALVEASAGGSPSGLDTTQVTAEAISQTLDDTPAELGLMGYFFKRKQTDDGEQAPVGADVPEAQNGPIEDLGLIDLLLGKKPQSLVIAAGISVANESVPEPEKDPLPEGGLINYFINRGNTSLRPAADRAQAANPSQPTQATAKSSISPSQVPSNYTTAVESAAISDGQALVGADVPEAHNGPIEDLGLIGLLLGKKPQSLVIAAGIPVANGPEPVEEPLPEVGLIKYFSNRTNTSIMPAVGPAPAVNRSQPTPATAKLSIGTPLVPGKYLTAFDPVVISDDLLRIKVVLGQLPRSALASLEQSNHVAMTPKIVNAAPLVENTDSQLALTQKHDSPGPATAADVEGKGLLNLLLQRQP